MTLYSTRLPYSITLSWLKIVIIRVSPRPGPSVTEYHCPEAIPPYSSSVDGLICILCTNVFIKKKKKLKRDPTLTRRCRLHTRPPQMVKRKILCSLRMYSKHIWARLYMKVRAALSCTRCNKSLRVVRCIQGSTDFVAATIARVEAVQIFRNILMEIC